MVIDDAKPRSEDASGAMFGGRKRLLLSASIAALLLSASSLGFTTAAHAESMSGALAKSYGYSPDLNQQRAATRAADETVPRATAGWRPTLSATSSVGLATTKTVNAGKITTDSNTIPRVNSIAVTQTLYNGGRTGNTVRQAGSTVMQSRETLRQSEQDVLAAASTAYMNVLRDTALLELQNNNVEVLQQQLKQTEDRFQVGEVTRTDVAQSQASLAQGQANASQARFDLQNSIAVYRQVIGEQPRNLEPARPVEPLLPRNLEAALGLAMKEHPRIQGAMHAVDVAAANVNIQEGALLPTVTATGQAQVSREPSGFPNYQNKSYSAVASLTVPLYEGGATYAGIRQAKELLGQTRLQLDLQRETVRSGVIVAWGAFQTTKLTIQSFQAQVRANEIALEGVREEAKVGQRTTLDVLNAQQTLLNSRVSLVTAQRNQVVASYALLAASGQLSAATLGLRVATYDPTLHFDQVKDKWIGTRTPDGN
jgi:outer membrane protein